MVIKKVNLDIVVGVTSTLPETEFDMVDELHKVSGAEVPAPLANLKNKTARFSDVTEVNDMENYVLGALGID